MKDKVPPELRNQLGLAIAQLTYRAYRTGLESGEWRELEAQGAMPQRLLWASTGTKDPDVSETLYVEALAAPGTINTLPEKTLKAWQDSGHLRSVLDPERGEPEDTLAGFRKAGINDVALAAQLQREGAEAFTKSWNDLLACIREKRTLTGSYRN